MKVCIFSGNSIGGTFLDWSIHFLSGQTHYYSSKNNQYIELSQNPINYSQQNAHGHLRNHTAGADKTKQYLETCASTGLYSLYAAPALTRRIVQKYKIEPVRENLTLVKQQELKDTARLFSILAEYSSATIHLAGESFVPLYFTSIRSIDTFMFNHEKPKSVDDKKEELDSIFFNDDVARWNNLGLTNTWDVRERRALHARPLTPMTEYCIPYPHLRIDCREYWYNGFVVINRVMNYLNLSIQKNRVDHWKQVYDQWKQIHINAMEFAYNCDHIVSAIVNNWNYVINLTPNQEVVVQHFLIYKYGLNLKTWQLEKFPNNTQDLHKLLEPNIHTVNKIY